MALISSLHIELSVNEFSFELWPLLISRYSKFQAPHQESRGTSMMERYFELKWNDNESDTGTICFENKERQKSTTLLQIESLDTGKYQS